MMRTHVQLSGDAAVTAEITRDIDTNETVVRLYVGEAVVITMPVQVADAIGDALADVDDIITVSHG